MGAYARYCGSQVTATARARARATATDADADAGADAGADEGKRLRFVEADVDSGNPASVRVLEKLGMERRGWKEVAERAFLAGRWRERGYWVYGKWV